MIAKLNGWLTGFRTVLTAWGGYALLYLDLLVGGLTGFSKESLKGAAVMAALITVKQIKTDIIPRLKGMFKK